MNHIEIDEDIEHEINQLEAIHSALVSPNNTTAQRVAFKFFSGLDITHLDDDMEAIRELRDISAKHHNEYEEPLERVLSILGDIQDTHESIM